MKTIKIIRKFKKALSVLTNYVDSVFFDKKMSLQLMNDVIEYLNSFEKAVKNKITFQTDLVQFIVI